MFLVIQSQAYEKSAEGTSGKIGIKLSGAVGSGDATVPTQFKVQDDLWFNSVKSGDKISFSAQNANGVMTIQKRNSCFVSL